MTSEIITQAQIAEKNGNWAQAKELWLQVIAKDSRAKPVTWLSYAKSLERLGDLESALHTYAVVAEKFPKNIWPLMGQARVAENQKNIALARQIWLSAVVKFPESLQINFRAYLFMRRLQEIHDDLDLHLTALIVNDFKNGNEIPPLYALVAIEVYLKHGNVAHANDFIYQFLKRWPEHISYAHQMLGFYWSFDQHDEAVNLSEQLLEINQKSHLLQHLRMRCFNQAGFPDRAIEYYSNLKQVDNKLNLLTEIGRSENLMQSLDSSETCWRKVLTHEPLHPDGLLNVARILSEKEFPWEQDATLISMLGDSHTPINTVTKILHKDQRWLSVGMLSEQAFALPSFFEEHPKREQIELLLSHVEASAALGFKSTWHSDLSSVIFAVDEKNNLKKQFLNLQAKLVPEIDFLATSYQEKTIPIDAVYTWVNGDDPEWSRRFEQVTAFLPKKRMSNTNVNANRYKNSDEIIFSLRSLNKFFPQVRNIFILTDRQKFEIDDLPAEMAKKLHFVDHREILPGNVVLPTFNSNVLSAFLHKIPGLSETFLYFNDDVFLGVPLNQKNLIDEQGRPFIETIITSEKRFDKVTRRMMMVSADKSIRASDTFTKETFINHMGYFPPSIQNHQYKVLTKSLCEDVLKTFWSKFRDHLFSHQVRQPDTLRVGVMRDFMGVVQGHLTQKPLHFKRNNSIYFFRGIGWEHVAVLLMARPHSYCINSMAQDIQPFRYLTENYLHTDSISNDEVEVLLRRDPIFNRLLDRGCNLKEFLATLRTRLD